MVPNRPPKAHALTDFLLLCDFNAIKYAAIKPSGIGNEVLKEIVRADKRYRPINLTIRSGSASSLIPYDIIIEDTENTAANTYNIGIPPLIYILGGI